ncbi:hypothetical protein THAOC_36644, partial [Thalassiosira oceanica]
GTLSVARRRISLLQLAGRRVYLEPRVLAASIQAKELQDLELHSIVVLVGAPEVALSNCGVEADDLLVVGRVLAPPNAMNQMQILDQRLDVVEGLDDALRAGLASHSAALLNVSDHVQHQPESQDQDDEIMIYASVPCAVGDQNPRREVLERLPACKRIHVLELGLARLPAVDHDRVTCQLLGVELLA